MPVLKISSGFKAPLPPGPAPPGRSNGIRGANANGAGASVSTGSVDSGFGGAGTARSSVASTSSSTSSQSSAASSSRTLVMDYINEYESEEEKQIRLAKSATAGLLYDDRLKTFKANRWPTDKKVRCTARRLALNGFVFEAIGEVSCVVCLTKISNLQPDSDPWNEHKNAAPNCQLVKFGKPLQSNGHTVGQLILLANERVINIREKQFKDAKAHIEAELTALRKFDILLGELRYNSDPLA